MPTTTQLVITEQSKPGVLARVASVLGEAGVNIKTFSAAEGIGTAKIRKGTLRFVVADLDRARVALKQGSLVVNSSQGGGSKDTWVLMS